MKVCIIAPNFKEPHAWMVSAYNTAILLKKQGFDVVVLTSRTKDSKKFEIIEGVKVYRMFSLFIPDPFNYTFTPGLFFHLRKVIKKEKPDSFLVSKHMFYTSLSAICLRLMGKKVVLQTDTFPGINWFAPSKLLNLFMWIYARTLGMLILRSANKVVLLHEGLANTAKKIGLKNFFVIHNGVDLSNYKNVKKAKDILKFKGKQKLVSYVGRLDEVKGYKLLLKTASKMPDIKFLFVCGEKYKRKRLQLQKKYKNCLFLGFRKDIPQILACSDVFVLPSYSEGLPNTLMEAMASSLACVASGVGGVPYLIKNGFNGLLVRPGSINELQTNISKLLDNSKLSKKLGTKAKETIKKSFNQSKIAKDWKSVLK